MPLPTSEEAKSGYHARADRGDLSVRPVWAGEALDLITEVAPAADLVATITREAESALARAGRPSSRR